MPASKEELFTHVRTLVEEVWSRSMISAFTELGLNPDDLHEWERFWGRCKRVDNIVMAHVANKLVETLEGEQVCATEHLERWYLHTTVYGDSEEELENFLSQGDD